MNTLRNDSCLPRGLHAARPTRHARRLWFAVIGLVVFAAGACESGDDVPFGPPGDAGVSTDGPLAAGRCGDGRRDPGEACDGDDIGGLSCADFQLGASGALTCRGDCTLDANACAFDLHPGAPSLEDEACQGPDGCVAPNNIIGGIDWLDTTTLPLGVAKDNARASGMIRFVEGGRTMRCSATLVSRDLLVTNHHCAPDAATATTTRFFPTTESDVAAVQRQLDSFVCPNLVATDCAHDVSILRCDPHPATGLLPGEAYGFVTIQLTPPAPGQGVYLVHTNCDHRGNTQCTPVKLYSPGVVSTYGAECLTFQSDPQCGNCRSSAPQARHTCDSLGGSSGGGLYDAATHRLIGLNWGAVVRQNGTGGWNYGSSLSDLAATDPTFALLLQSLACEPESCDGRDNDCDGLTDEEVDPLAEASDKCPRAGICAGGQAREVCRDGRWECVLPSDYIPEECPIARTACGTGSLSDPTCGDGVDNDCDGVVDENGQYDECLALPDYWKVREGRACFHGDAGRCATDGGTYECVQLAEGCGVRVDCVGGTHPETEQCDAQDHDCDGQTWDRNDIDGDGAGDCPERQDCDESRTDVHPNAGEVCDGRDNDCDGSADETFACRMGEQRACGSSVGACRTGTQTCTSTCSWSACSGVAPALEICDGLDNDCDGQSDEGFGCRSGAQRSCGTSVGACTVGTETCTSSCTWGACTGVAAVTERCNGRDDDCDGSVDEGDPCGGTPRYCQASGGSAACADIRAVLYKDRSWSGDSRSLSYAGAQQCIDLGQHGLSDNVDSMRLYAPTDVYFVLMDDPCNQSWELQCWIRGNGGVVSIPDMSVLRRGASGPNWRCKYTCDSECQMDNRASGARWVHGAAPF